MQIATLQEMQTMKLEANNNFSDHFKIQNINNQNNNTNEKATSNFSQMFNNALDSVNSLQHTANTASSNFDQGDRSLTLADVMIARNKASVSLDATIQVRNKIVDSYKELMNMPV